MTINCYKISLGDNENVLKLIKVTDVKLHIYYKPLNCCCSVAMCHVQFLVTPWTVAHQSPLFVRFPRQEYWSDCHFLLLGIFPTQGSNTCLLHWQADSLPLSREGSPHHRTAHPKHVNFIVHKLYLNTAIFIHYWKKTPGCSVQRLQNI